MAKMTMLEMVRNVLRRVQRPQHETKQRIEREIVAQLQALIEETRQISTEIRRLRSQ